jgi:hypothetical protein
VGRRSSPRASVFRKVDAWQSRSTQALHEKLDAIADGLADLMEHQLDRDRADLTVDIEELKGAVGLQHER